MKTTHFLFLLFGILHLSSCVNLPKLVEKKRYEKAVEAGISKFQNNTKRDPADVKAFETAFNQTNIADLNMARYLKEEKREENWLRINETYEKIKNRQARVQTITPLVDEAGYKANLNFVDVQYELNESTAKSAELYYNKASKLLADAQAANDRFKAREAYNEFVNMDKYDSNFRDGKTLKNQAKELGTTVVLLLLLDNTGRNIPVNQDSVFEKNLFSNDTWITYTRLTNGNAPHYTITLDVQNGSVTPNATDSREFQESAKVQDGVEYVKDSNGKLVLNDKGDPITTPKMIDVNCVVKETRYHKTGTLVASGTIADNTAGRTIAQKAFNESALFEYFTAAILSGDVRAASATTTERIKKRQPEFPADNDLIHLASPKLYKPFRDFFAANKANLK